MHLYAFKGLYSFAELLLQCMHVSPFLFWICCHRYTIVSMTLSARGLAHSGAKKSISFAAQTSLLLVLCEITFLKVTF